MRHFTLRHSMTSLHREWAGHVSAGLAGALVPLAFSPFDYWPVMLISTGLLFLLLNRADSTRSHLWRGFLFGAGMYGTGVSWVYVSIQQFGGAPVPLAALLTALFVLALAAVFITPLAWLFSRLKVHCSEVKRVLLFAGLWVLFEWMRSWLLTGFPWLLSGYTLLDTPFSGLAPITGVYGLSLLVALISAATAAIIHNPRSKSLYSLLAVVVLLSASSVWIQGKDWTTPVTSQPLTFSAVQGNISQNLKWDPGHLDRTVRTYTSLSANQWEKDFLLWPENSIPAFPQQLPGLISALEDQATASDTALLIGAPWYNNGPYYNSLFGLGKASGEYFKQKLVPFGEFVPLESVLRGMIAFFDLPMSSFSRGTTEQNGLTVKGHSLAPYICYEVVYPDFAARQAKGKDFLVTISNDTWFGKSIGPEQHFQMVRMRSLETGRYQLRATNDGITALIGPHGDIIKTIPRYKQGVLEGELSAMSGQTPFMRFGSWPVLFISAVLVIPALFRRKR